VRYFGKDWDVIINRRYRQILALLFLLSSALYADRSGPYLGIGYGIGEIDDDNYFKERSYSQIKEKEPEALYLYAGAFINENLSVELDYVTFGDVIAENASHNQLKDSVSIFSAVAVAHYPVFDDRIDLFVRFGAGQVKGTEKGDEKRNYNEAALLFGAGAGYRPADFLTFKLGYDRYVYDKKSALTDDDTKYSTVIDFFYAAFEVQF
jgi:opacity protein-like surface antigen